MLSVDSNGNFIIEVYADCDLENPSILRKSVGFIEFGLEIFEDDTYVCVWVSNPESGNFLQFC